jgi:hypothetical protein
MTRGRTRLLLAAATLVSGILAGSVFDRVFVGGPAWHTLGAQAWVEFSRLADLGPGRIAYSVEGIGAALLMLAAALSNYLDGEARSVAALPLYFAAIISVLGLLLTLKAAPIMLGLSSPLSAQEAQRAFDEFFFWGLYLRGAADLLAFAGGVWALASSHNLANP